MNIDIELVDKAEIAIQNYVNSKSVDVVFGLTEAVDTKISLGAEYGCDIREVWKTFSGMCLAKVLFKDIYGSRCQLDIILVVDEGGEANKVMPDALVRRIKDAMSCESYPICLIDVEEAGRSEFGVTFPYGGDDDDELL
ncbi:hypothetical protein GR11A_00177 [Vibrio phage vB_VcorM_GR11A]|nr:hypothetical protein GR11A_00177 [Vibrio phage vB_VcorM_GR11A]